MWNDDLENAYKVTGEGNEENIMQVLYDLYDDGTNESFDKISIGHKNLWNLVKGSKAKTFSQFANYCYSSTLFTNDEFGKLLENYGMASSYFYATSTTDPNTPPTFRWKSSNNNSSNRYELEFLDANKNTAIKKESLTDLSYTLTKDGYSFDSFDHIDNIEGTNFDYYAYNQQYWVQAVRFTPTEMGDYTISLSSQYDNYLYVFDPRLGTSMYQNGEYDDDSGEGSNALLKKHLEKGIPYLVIFSQYNPSSTFTDFDKGDDCLVSFRKN